MGAIAEADVGDDLAPIQMDDQHHALPNRGVADDGSRRGAPNPVDLESEPAKGHRKRPVHLITPSTTSLADDPLFEPGLFEGFGLVERDV